MPLVGDPLKVHENSVCHDCELLFPDKYKTLTKEVELCNDLSDSWLALILFEFSKLNGYYPDLIQTLHGTKSQQKKMKNKPICHKNLYAIWMS